jgi:PAS domain S-box-containing protein
MSIRQKTFLSLLASVALLFLALHLSARDIFLHRFKTLEDEQLQTNVDRVQRALNNRQHALQTLTRDWAHWDTAYAFVLKPTPEFIASNLTPETMDSLGANFIALIDRNHKPVIAGMYDHETRTLETKTPNTQWISEHRDALLATNDTFERAGLITVHGKTLVFASTAILTSTKTGPYAGTLILGRWLTNNLVAEMAAETRLDLSLLEHDGRKPGTPLGPGQPVISHDGNSIVGSLVLRDADEAPVNVITVRMDREIIRQGEMAMRSHLLYLIAFNAGFCLLVYFSLNKIIVRRLHILAHQVAEARSRDLEPVAVDGHDELRVLQDNINTLLADIRTSETSYETFFRNSGTANAVLGHDGLIQLVNAEFERLSGKPRVQLEKQIHIYGFLPDIDPGHFACAGAQCDGSKTMHKELLFHGPGHPRHVLAAISALPGQQRHIVALQDISDLKASQNELMAVSRELEVRVSDRTKDLQAVNTRLEEQIQQRIATGRILKVLGAVSLTLSTADNTAKAFRDLLAILCGLEPIDCGAAYVRETDQDVFKIMAQHSVDSVMFESVPTLAPESIPGLSSASPAPIYGPQEHITGLENDILCPNVRAAGMIPISFQNQVVALLYIASRTTAEIPQAVRSILDTIATQTGGAIVRIAAQESVALTAKKMEAIFENSAVGIMHVSSSRHILKANQRLADMFGYDCHELVGRHVETLHVTTAAAESFVQTHYPRLRAEHQLLNLEQRMKTKSGEIRWFKCHGRMVDADDLEQGFVWVLEDIHDMKISSEELVRFMDELQTARDMQEENAAKLVQLVEELDSAKQVAESASMMKSQFLANVSHEIRTPMNAIMGMTDVVLGTDISPEQRRALTIVKNAAEALLDLINGVLDLSKIEAGQFELEIRPFDLRSVVERTVTTLGLTASEKGLDLICHLPPDLPREMEGDPVRLRQVLINLLGNAVKFTPSGHVRCFCRLEPDGDGCVLHFQVEDSGIGIPPSKQETIFDDFTQVDSSSTRIYGGTGLGLSISRKLVQLMNGEIKVLSTPGQGSTFQFSARMGKASPPDRTHAQIFDQAATVLIVANNPLIQVQLKELLDFWGLGTVLTSCMDCMDLSRSTFDLAVMDTDFGDYACMELLEPGGVLNDVPTIVLTQLGDQSISNLKAQIRSILTKPLLQDELLRALAHIFNLRLNLPENQATVQTLKAVRALDILLVEDVATNRELAQMLLGKMGHRIHDARDGLDALTMLGRHRFDLVFMDLQMPVMDGFTATQIIRACEKGTPAPKDMDDSFLVRELREKIEGSFTPIVAMTAHAMLEDRQRCLEIGMDGYLTKPLRLDEVHAVLTRYGGGPVMPAASSEPQRPQKPQASPAPVTTQEPADEATRFVERMLVSLYEQYELDRDSAMPLIENLFETLTEHRKGLDACLASPDTEQIMHHAHSIKGMLLNMGLTPEGLTAKDLEELARSGAPAAELTEAATALLRVTDSILVELRPPLGG